MSVCCQFCPKKKMIFMKVESRSDSVIIWQIIFAKAWWAFVRIMQFSLKIFYVQSWNTDTYRRMVATNHWLRHWLTVGRHKGICHLKPALRDSGSLCIGLWSTFRIKNGMGIFKDLFILSANRMIVDCPFVHVMPKSSRLLNHFYKFLFKRSAVEHLKNDHWRQHFFLW